MTTLYVRYQELIGLQECEANKDGIDAHVPCIDSLLPMEDFSSRFVDSVIAECLLNNMGKWLDNGLTADGQDLLCRVYMVVSDVNRKLIEAQLHSLPVMHTA